MILTRKQATTLAAHVSKNQHVASVYIENLESPIGAVFVELHDANDDILMVGKIEVTGKNDIANEPIPFASATPESLKRMGLL